MALTPMQEKFVQEYIKCRKVTESARRAGYAHPHVQGSRLLENVSVSDEIKSRTAESGIEIREVLDHLADIARGTMENFTSFTFEPYPDFTLDLGKARERNVLHLIKKIKYDKDGHPEIELYSALDANKALAQLLTAGPKGSEDDPFHIKHIHELSDSELARIAATSGGGAIKA